MGQTVEVTIDLTTNHMGYFEIKLCAQGKKKTPATEECFDKHPLVLDDNPDTTRYYIKDGTPKKMMVK